MNEINYALFFKQRLVLFLALFTLAVLTLGLMADCDKGDSGPGSYNPKPGDNVWRLAPAAAVAVRPAPSAFTGKTALPTYGRVVAISGDSIVAEGNLAVPDRLITKLTGLEGGAATVVDRTRGGQRLVDGTDPINLIDDWPGLLATHPSPTVVMVEVGTDDLYGSPDADWEAAYTQLDAQAQARGVLLVPMLLTPLNDAANNHYLREPQRNRFNAWLKSHFGVTRVVDTPAVLALANGQLNPAYDFGDGMHLNAAGVAVLADAMAAHLRSS